MRRRLACLGVAVVVAACGSAAPHPTVDRVERPQPLAGTRALELARVLLGDYTHAGSRLAGTYTLKGQSLRFTGAVDFRRNRGVLSIRQSSLPGAAPRVFYWKRSNVLAQAAPGSRRYLSGTLDPQTSPVDRLIFSLGLLSSPVIDNIQQLESSGVLFLGSSAGLDRFRDGPMTLSVRHRTGLLAGVNLREADGSRITIGLLSHAPQDIRVPGGSS